MECFLPEAAVLLMLTSIQHDMENIIQKTILHQNAIPKKREDNSCAIILLDLF